MARKTKLGEQIAAVGVARRMLTGVEKPPASERERAYLADCLTGTETLLIWARDHEQALRELIKATQREAAPAQTARQASNPPGAANV